MLSGFLKLVSDLFTSPAPERVGYERKVQVYLVAGTALLVGVWLFVYHLQRFWGLGTTSDLYVYVQLANSWLDGKYLHDNFFGNYLTVHTYFLCPLFAVVAYPFGAPGLLFTLALAGALNLVALVRILRLFQVSNRLAVIFALFATLMPLSVMVYQDDICGFHIELLIPCLAAWLTFFLLKRNWVGSLTMGVVLIGLKEDSALTLFAVTTAVMVEDWLRVRCANSPGRRREAWNYPALAVSALAALALPVLLYVVKSQLAEGYFASGSFDKVRAVDGSSVSEMGALFSYAATHAGTWLQSAQVAQWFVALLAGTFGLILLRPHLVLLGLGTSFVAWLVQGDLMWAPRFAPTLAFIQIVSAFAFVSVCRFFAERPVSSQRVRVGGWVVVAAWLVVGLARQYKMAPQTHEVYAQKPDLKISEADRKHADVLFERYRREARAEDPVIASDYLFRYAHDRNLFWYNRLKGRSRPEWILWDQEATPLTTLELFLKTDTNTSLANYELVGQANRFLLYKFWGGRHTETPSVVTPISGRYYGQLRLKVQFAAHRGGNSEPLVSVGRPGNGDLFFVHYLNDHQLVLGFDSVGVAVQTGDTIDFVPGQTYELELFCGALMRPTEGDAADSVVALKRLAYRNFVTIRWNGREVLNALSESRPTIPSDVRMGYNFVRSASAVAQFSGKLTEVHRGGFPALLAGHGFQDFGAVNMLVQLPHSPVGLAEPLFVVGVAGEANLGYVRVLPDGKIKVGMEFWSVGVKESDAFSVDTSKPVEITYSMPVFYPPVGDPRWGSVPKGMQVQLRSLMRVSINGRTVINRKIDAPVPRHPGVTYGKNPLGGSVVEDAFTGSVLQVSRQPLDAQ